MEPPDTRHWTERRTVRGWMVVAAVAGVWAAAIMLFAFVESNSPAEAGPPEVGAAVAVLDGVPQDGITLGWPVAPSTLTVYTSLDVVARSFDPELPALVRRHVRPGRLKVQLRTLSSDPEHVLPEDGSGAVAAHAAQAAGLQDRLWDFTRVLAAHSAGWIDEAGVAEIVELVPDLDARKVAVDAGSPRVAQAVRRADRLAAELGVVAAPTLVLERPGQAPVTLDPDAKASLVEQLDALL